MFDSQTIHLQGTGGANPKFILLSPWFPRGGDYGIFTLEAEKLSDITTNLSLSVEFLHKNSIDPGNGGAVAGLIVVKGNETLTVAKRVSLDVTAGFKELVRYQFTLAFAGTPAVTTGFWATFRMLSPVWYDKV